MTRVHNMACLELERLWELYMKALHAFHEAQEPLLAGLRPSDPRYAEARGIKDVARGKLVQARKSYWEHVQAHRCRQAVSPAAAATVLDRLHTEMLEARRAFDGATRTFDRLIGVADDLGGTQDGMLAVQQARHIHAEAHRVYERALKRYADYVTQGVVPEDLRPLEGPQI